MRRRLTFVSTLIALLMIFVLPASTVSAATFEYNVRKNTCTASGGDNGYGHLFFKVKLYEWGNTGANKFTFAAKAQHKELGQQQLGDRVELRHRSPTRSRATAPTTPTGAGTRTTRLTMRGIASRSR